VSTHSIFVVAPRGIVGLLADELHELGARKVREEPAGCRVRGPLSFAYRICMWSRLATRVLLHLDDLRAPDADALYEGVKAIAWEEHLRPDGTLAVDFVGRGAGVTDTRFGAQKVKDAIVDRLRTRFGRRPDVDTRMPDVRVNAFARGSGCSISIDLAGDSLHRRGYRREIGPAPLKENVAAALLRLGGWAELAAEGAPFLDPMTGAGTLPIEAAMIATDRAPGLDRERWGFSGWLGHEADRWDEIAREADDRARAGGERTLGPIVGADEDPRMLDAAYGNACRVGLSERVRLEQRAIDDWTAGELGERGGLVAVNPPHGERLGAKASARDRHIALGATLLRAFPGWRAVVLTTDDELRWALGLPAAATHAIDNGPIECVAIDVQVPAAEGEAPAAAAIDRELVAPFVNRVKKNIARLRPWADSTGVTCWRVYDAEIPEFNVAIDRYEAQLYVQEFAPPLSVDPDLAARRLEAILAVLPEIFGIPHEAIHLRRRKRQKSGSQYGAVAGTGRTLEIQEGGLRFEVDLDDHLDTGIFLDHRITRAKIRELAAGRRFLNLFAYTGTATVYAAAGGAVATTSVDLSNTYLDRARRNLARNGLDGPQHQFVRADVRRFLQSTRERWDLVFLDPPTYSRSKAMDGDFDVQRDHAELIEACLRRIEPGGELLFSTNARRFELDPSLAARADDLTDATLPRDFQRRPPAHRVWRLRP
jgi:23S rRNA (guanine2445-N2)-methyltransferase / 23S rRNA (guanine2069-N7)-methyltransferase